MNKKICTIVWEEKRTFAVTCAKAKSANLALHTEKEKKKIVG